MAAKIKSTHERRPWVDWPMIRDTARSNGWGLLAERGGVARMERRDPRSETGAVTLHVEFDSRGLIVGAWIAGLGRRIRAHDAEKLDTIVSWLREAVPVGVRG
jgi:hypothetical protein